MITYITSVMYKKKKHFFGINVQCTKKKINIKKKNYRAQTLKKTIDLEILRLLDEILPVLFIVLHVL